VRHTPDEITITTINAEIAEIAEKRTY